MKKNPVMYSTVISGRPTVIKHQTPQPKGVGVHPVAAGAFALNSSQVLAENKNLSNGSYSIPVQISSSGEKYGYETPNFIHTGERKVEEKETEANGSEAISQDPAVFLKQNMMRDISDFTANFDTTKDKAERISACKSI